MSELQENKISRKRYRRRRSRRSRRRPLKKIAGWFARNGFDLLLLLLLVVGILFLLNPVPRLAIPFLSRTRLGRWLIWEEGIRAVGGVMLTLAVVVGAVRVPVRVNHHAAWWSRQCPQCGNSELRRIHRKWQDRLLGRLGIPVRRYVCRQCEWHGPRIDESRIHY